MHIDGGIWQDAMTYNHAEWVYELAAPGTEKATLALRVFGIGAALCSMFDNGATVIFAILCGQHIFTSICMFISESYVFSVVCNVTTVCSARAGAHSLTQSLTQSLTHSFRCQRRYFLFHRLDFSSACFPIITHRIASHSSQTTTISFFSWRRSRPFAATRKTLAPGPVGFTSFGDKSS